MELTDIQLTTEPCKLIREAALMLDTLHADRKAQGRQFTRKAALFWRRRAADTRLYQLFVPSCRSEQKRPAGTSSTATPLLDCSPSLALPANDVGSTRRMHTGGKLVQAFGAGPRFSATYSVSIWVSRLFDTLRSRRDLASRACRSVSLSRKYHISPPPPPPWWGVGAESVLCGFLHRRPD